MVTMTEISPERLRQGDNYDGNSKIDFSCETFNTFRNCAKTFNNNMYYCTKVIAVKWLPLNGQTDRQKKGEINGKLAWRRKTILK